MQELQLVGVHEDGEHLLLKAPDGERFRLPIDEALRAAARRDRARLGQLQIATQQTLRPREIQARIRAGESAEDVALATGMPVEHVRRYEGPVLAERAHVADRAGRQVVRTSGPDRGVQLAALVAERLAVRGVDGGAWDSWRADDGRWIVQLAFRAGSKDRRARWMYDLGTGGLEPVDDEARWLSAAQPPDDGLVPGRRLAAVRERVYDVEADGGVREARADDATAELLEELRGRRGRRQPVLSPAERAQLDGEGAPPGAHPAASAPHEAVDAEILALPEPRTEPGHDHDPQGSERALGGGPAPAGTGLDQTNREQAGGDQTSREQAGTDQAGTDQAGTDQAGTDQAGRRQTRRDDRVTGSVPSHRGHGHEETVSVSGEADSDAPRTGEVGVEGAGIHEPDAGRPDADNSGPDKPGAGEHADQERDSDDPRADQDGTNAPAADEVDAETSTTETSTTEASTAETSTGDGRSSTQDSTTEDSTTQASTTETSPENAGPSDEPSTEVADTTAVAARGEVNEVDAEGDAGAVSPNESAAGSAKGSGGDPRQSGPARTQARKAASSKKRRSRGSRGGGGGAKPRRASVPSWDEIVFGARGGDQSG